MGDWQLARFRRGKREAGAVLDTGLWRYTRHPNYFGEALLWWGIYLIALSAGAWWTVFAPLLMTFLLLRVSGVALLEKDIADRRPAYRDYIRRTNAFFPGRPQLRAAHWKMEPDVMKSRPSTEYPSPPGPVLALAAWTPAHAVESPSTEAGAAADAWRFRVYLDDREIGYHNFYLQQSGDHARVAQRSQLRVPPDVRQAVPLRA